jgi:hypothetical protein
LFFLPSLENFTDRSSLGPEPVCFVPPKGTPKSTREAVA